MKNQLSKRGAIPLIIATIMLSVWVVVHFWSVKGARRRITAPDVNLGNKVVIHPHEHFDVRALRKDVVPDSDLVVKLPEEEELRKRMYPEHIKGLKDSSILQKKRSNWKDQTYSRPWINKDRIQNCSDAAATELNLQAVSLVRKSLDGLFPPDFEDAMKLFGEAVEKDPSCGTVRLNYIMLLMSEAVKFDIDEINTTKIETVRTLFLDGEASSKDNARYWLWRSFYEEIATNESTPIAMQYLRRGFSLDNQLKHEHVHPLRSEARHGILGFVTKGSDYIIRRGLVQWLFFYEYMPYFGGYPKVTYEHTQKFLRDWHVKIDGALPDYCWTVVSRTYRLAIDDPRAGLNGIFGYKGAATHESNSDALNMWFNVRTSEFIERVTGIDVDPTYGYMAGYVPGDVLRPHTDRKACEFTLTTLIEAYPHTAYCPLFAQKTPWKIDDDWIGRYEEGTVKKDEVINISPQLNQWVIIRGRAKPHLRPALPRNVTCTTLLAHYVPRGKPTY